GDRFKGIAADLKAIVGGEPPRANAPAAQPPSPAPAPPKVNVPVKISENERARGLVTLDEKFVIQPADMHPKAAAYFRRRPFLSPEVCRQWRLGYLPRDAGGEDKS